MANYSRLFQLDPDVDEQLKKKKGLYPAADMQDLFAGSGQHASVMAAAAEESARAQQAFAGATKQGYERMKREQDKAKAAGTPTGTPTAPAQPPLIPPGPLPEQPEKPEQPPPPVVPVPDVVPPPTKPPGYESSPSQVDDWMNNRSSAPTQTQGLFTPPSAGMESRPRSVFGPEAGDYQTLPGDPNNPGVMQNLPGDPNAPRIMQKLPLLPKGQSYAPYEEVWNRPKFQGSFRNANFSGFYKRGGRIKKNEWGIVAEDGPEIVLNKGGEVEVIPLPKSDEVVPLRSPTPQSPEIAAIATRPDVPGDPGGYWEHPSHPSPMQGLITRRDRDLELAGMGPDVYQPPGSEPVAPRQRQLITPASGDMEEIRQDLGSPGVPGMGPTRERIVAGEPVSSNFVGRPLEPVDRAELALKGRIQEGPVKKGVWSRLGKGFMWGVNNWKAEGGPGGLGGALGAGIAGLTTYGVSPKTQAAIDYKQDIGKLMGNYKTALQPQLLDMELKQEQAKTAGAVADAQTKRANSILTTYKPAIDAAMKAGKSIPQITKELNALGVRATDFDVRELIEGYDPLGLPQARYKTGDPGQPPQWFPHPSRGPDLTKVQVPIKVDGKTVGTQLSPQAATTAVGAAGRSDAIEVRKQALEQQQQNQTRIQGNSDRDFDLRKKQFVLSQQREQRLHAAAQEAIRTKKLNDPVAKALAARQTDLEKARQAVEAVRAEADRIFAEPTYTYKDPKYNADTEEQREKDLADIAKRERKALALYDAVLKRIERGQ